MPSVELKSPSPSILRRPGFWITLLTVVPLVIGSAYVLENWLGARKLARVKAEVAAAGIELDMHRTASTRPPAADNFCATPLLLAIGNGVTSGAEHQSIERLVRWRDWYSSPNFSPKSGQPGLQSPFNPEPTDWVVIRNALAHYYSKSGLASDGPEPLQEIASLLDRDLASVMADLEAALPRPRSVIVPTYLDQLRSGKGAMNISLEVMGLRNLSSVVNLRIHADLATGRHDRAVAGIRVLLRLAEGEEAWWPGVAWYPSPIRETATRTTWTAAISPRDISKDRWLELAAAHHAGGHLDRIHRALGSGLVADHASWNSLPRDRKLYWTLAATSPGSSRGSRWEKWLFELIPRGWIDFNTAHFLEGGLSFLQRLGGSADPKRFDQDKNREWAREWLISRSGLGHARYAHSTLEAVISRTRNLAQSAFLSRLAETACAVEAYHADRQTYPSDLAELVPGYLSLVPSDVDGQPIRYALDPGNGRYRLWSIGEDGVDDGGVEKSGRSTKNPRNPHSWSQSVGDWVWQYPSP